MKLKKTISAAAYAGDIKITVDFNSDGLMRNEVTRKMDELTGAMMQTLSVESCVPISRIRIK